MLKELASQQINFYFFLFSRTQKLIEINFTHLIAEACAEVVVEIPLGYNSNL